MQDGANDTGAYVPLLERLDESDERLILPRLQAQSQRSVGQ